MSRDDIQKLLGGYATGTLTPGERDALFAAALEDQELFDSLMREEPLRELLQDPVAKNRLRAALEAPARVPWHDGWLRPVALTAAAAAVVGIGVVMFVRHPPSAPPVEIAQVEPARPPATLLPAPRPATAEAPKPSLAKAVPSRQGAAAPRVATRAKDVELQAAQPALKGAVAENKAEAKTAAPAPLPAAPPVDLRPALQAQPVAGAPARTGVGGFVDLRDARTLFSEPLSAPAVPTFRSNLVRSEGRGPAGPEAVSAPVADAVLSAAAHLGVRYTVWRRPPGGIFEEVAPGAGLYVGEELEVQIQANDAGYLYVFERGADGTWNLLATDRLGRMAVYTVPQSGSLRLADSGALELFVLFSRRSVPVQEQVPVSPAEETINSSPAERAIYVASTSRDLGAQRIGFSITLRAQSH